jgi:hypothetical protein
VLAPAAQGGKEQVPVLSSQTKPVSEVHTEEEEAEVVVPQEQSLVPSVSWHAGNEHALATASHIKPVSAWQTFFPHKHAVFVFNDVLSVLSQISPLKGQTHSSLLPQVFLIAKE